jgi:hypothetical protein
MAEGVEPELAAEGDPLAPPVDGRLGGWRASPAELGWLRGLPSILVNHYCASSPFTLRYCYSEAHWTLDLDRERNVLYVVAIQMTGGRTCVAEGVRLPRELLCAGKGRVQVDRRWRELRVPQTRRGSK